MIFSTSRYSYSYYYCTLYIRNDRTHSCDMANQSQSSFDERYNLMATLLPVSKVDRYAGSRGDRYQFPPTVQIDIFGLVDTVPPQSQRLKQMEAKMMQLVEGAKRLDAKRRELARHSEHQAIRMEGLEKELDRQLGISDDLRTQVRRSRVLYQTYRFFKSAWITLSYASEDPQVHDVYKRIIYNSTVHLCGFSFSAPPYNTATALMHLYEEDCLYVRRQDYYHIPGTGTY